LVMYCNDFKFGGMDFKLTQRKLCFFNKNLKKTIKLKHNNDILSIKSFSFFEKMC